MQIHKGYHYEYLIEEDGYLRITHWIDRKDYVLLFLITHIPALFLPELFRLFFGLKYDSIFLPILACGFCLFVVTFLIVAWHTNNFYFLKYSFEINSKGIKNRTDRGEVCIKWEELVSYGKEVISLKTRRRVCTVVYFSTRELDKESLRKIVTSSQSCFYENSEGFVVIAFTLDLEDTGLKSYPETVALYEKIESYVKLHKTES